MESCCIKLEKWLSPSALCSIGLSGVIWFAVHANVLFLSVCRWAIEIITPKSSSMEHVCLNLDKSWSFPHLEFRNTVLKIRFDFGNPYFIFEETWRATKNDKYLGRAPSVLFVVRKRWTSGIPCRICSEERSAGHREFWVCSDATHALFIPV